MDTHRESYKAWHTVGKAYWIVLIVFGIET